MMPGADFKAIREAIMDAYDRSELTVLVRELMDVVLANVVAPGAFPMEVFDLLRWAEKDGREAELISVAARAKPRNTKMQAVYRRYGMAVPVKIEVAGASIADSPSDSTQAGLERVIHPDLSFIDFGIWRERMTSIEGQVCQITLSGSPRGTGFLVGPDLVLTNYHVVEPVIRRGDLASQVRCIFDFKKLPDNTTPYTSVGLSGDRIVDSSPYSAGEAVGRPEDSIPTQDELDFALIRLNEPLGARPWALNPGNGAPQRGWMRFPREPEVLCSPMGVIIAQHPNGWPLKLGIDTKAIDREASPPLWLNSAGNRIRYATNTEPGSSGGPVLDMNWNLIALHHYGDPHYEHPRFNQGIPINRIWERLERVNKTVNLGEEPE